MRPIFLCGFMGCGKSTVGKILAKKMGCQCVDLDKYIEDTARMSIPEIFDKISGLVVFIDKYFNTCSGRIKNDPNRPIAYNSTREQLLERFDYRRPLYLAHSHYVISGGYPPIVIASKIQKLYKRFDFGQG